MKAIFVTGGKQYYVSEGDVIYVEKLDVEAGKDIEFTDVLMVGEKVGTPNVEGAKVVCTAEKNGKAKKFFHSFLPNHIFLFVIKLQP